MRLVILCFSHCSKNFSFEFLCTQSSARTRSQGQHAGVKIAVGCPLKPVKIIIQPVQLTSKCLKKAVPKQPKGIYREPYIIDLVLNKTRIWDLHTYQQSTLIHTFHFCISVSKMSCHYNAKIYNMPYMSLLPAMHFDDIIESI